MKYKVSWSPLAMKTYLETLKSVLENWNLKEVTKVERLINNKIKYLSNNGFLCPASSKN